MGAHAQCNPETTSDDNHIMNNKTPAKSHGNSQSVGCQTIFREQSAQTKLFLPQIRCHTEVEQNELFEVQCLLDTDAPVIDNMKLINKRQKQLEYERISKQCVGLTAKRQQISETLEWKEWLTRENDIEKTQTIRFRKVQNMLKQRDKMYETDLIKTIDQSLNCFNNEHKYKIENVK